jgi:hypothetical protein
VVKFPFPLLPPASPRLHLTSHFTTFPFPPPLTPHYTRMTAGTSQTPYSLATPDGHSCTASFHAWSPVLRTATKMRWRLACLWLMMCDKSRQPSPVSHSLV